MSSRTIMGLVLGMLMGASFGTARAQSVSNQATEMTFERPVRVPGHVLQPGTYWFKTQDSGSASDPNKVEVTDASGKKPIALLETQTADFAQFGQSAKAKGVNWPSGKVVLIVAEGRQGEPVTLLDWFYPGRTDGHKFVYKDNEQKQADEETHHTLAFNSGDKVTIGRSLASFE